MGVKLTRDVGHNLVGDLVVYRVCVTDLDGCLTSASTPVVSVTSPLGAVDNPDPEDITTGVFRFSFTPQVAGRYIVVAATGSYGLDDDALYVNTSTAATGMPTVAGYKAWTDDDGGSWSDDEIQHAMDAEAANQRQVCRVGAVYPPDLIEALYRRTQRSLAMRRLALAMPQGDADLGPSFIPRRDPEVRRLEAPYPHLKVG